MDGAGLAKLLAEVAPSDKQLTTLPTATTRFSLVYHSVPDLKVERKRISKLLGTDRFSLTAFETDPTLALSRSLLLQFAGLRRVLSDKALFEIAGYLTAELELTACEPDVGAPIFVEPDPRTQPITSPESAVIGLWCTSNAAAPVDSHWALDAIRIPQAWQFSPARGSGVLVGQPDTGIAAHVELELGLVDLAKAGNVVEGGPPTDPLAPGASNPGHGTATISVVASRQAGRVLGPAPDAQVAPIRCTDSVVLFDGAPVAAAIRHARTAGCDVVTMSLGGFFSSPLQAAIEDAVNAGMIILAAAGNCVGFVVYPASDANVIAVAGVDVNDKPWKGTSSGALVDIAAPGENVYVAVRKPNDGGVGTVGASQGTSFAVALTAGVAALWLSHHGKAAVRGEATKRGTTVHALFRSAVQQTARRPAGWKTNKYGAGIVDARKLLELTLGKIGAPGGAAAPIGTIETVNVLATSGDKIDGFDWERHGAEASLLAAKAAIAARRSQIGFESVGGGVLRPSAGLARTAPAILRRLYEDADLTGLRQVKAVGVRPIERLMTLSASTGTGLESAAALSPETAQNRLRGDLRQTLVDQMASTLNALPAEDDDVASARQDAVQNAEKGLEKVAKLGGQARLSAQEHFALEALVSLKSRPALRVQGDGINPQDPMLGDWTGTLFNDTDLSASISAVGRINLDGIHVGTGWVVAPGLIATNRHVAEAMAEEFATPSGRSMWVLGDNPTINFDASGLGAAKSFAIKEVVAVGPDRINEMVNFHHLDMAVFSVEEHNGAGMALPKPLPLLSDPDFTTRGSEILICGYPARPGVSTLRDPDTGLVRDDVIARLQKLFGFAYSVKYLSPGQVQAAPGDLDGDARSWVFGHDATTLGGNSGSWAIYLGQPMGVIGLHFGGGTLRANYAHSVQAVRESQAMPTDVLNRATWL